LHLVSAHPANDVARPSGDCEVVDTRGGSRDKLHEMVRRCNDGPCEGRVEETLALARDALVIFQLSFEAGEDCMEGGARVQPVAVAAPSARHSPQEIGGIRSYVCVCE
jgi:hypothetical protein